MHAKRERHSAHCRRIPESCTKQTPSFLRLLELFEVLFVEEEAAILHKLEELFLHDDDKANMMMSKKKRVPESCSKNACCC